MKKTIFIAVILATVVHVRAQDSRFTIGSKFGFGHSYMMPYKNAAFFPSWLVGLTTAYQAGENWAFGVDALYSSEGAKFKTADVTATTDLDYMRIPFRAMYHFGSSESDFRTRVSFGPTFGVLMAEGTGYKDMDFGLNAGLGFKYEMLESFWLTTDLDYYHGLMDIYAGTAEKERNGNIRLSLGLMFGL